MDPVFFFLIMIGAIYAFMFLPQQRRTKAHKQLLASLKEGDVVMTNGGIYGAIAEVEDDVVWLEVAPEIELKILRSSIADRAPEDSEDSEDSEDPDDDEAAELAEQGDEG